MTNEINIKPEKVFMYKSGSDFDWLIELEKARLIKTNFNAKLYSEKALVTFQIECEKEELRRHKDALKSRQEEYDDLETKIAENRTELNKLNSKLIEINKKMKK
jgi:predicted  nucleic acid-binding Zn-ribbon protein